MSDSYNLYKEANNRINKDIDVKFAKTCPDFRRIYNEILGVSSVTANGLEKRYKEALKKGKPSDFFKNYESDLYVMIRPDLVPVFYYEIDRVREYQYDDGYYRRSFRSSDYCTYIKLINKILKQFVYFSSMKVDINDYVSNNLPEDLKVYKTYIYGRVEIPFVIAGAIDSGDERIKNTIEDVVINSTADVSVELFRGIFASKDKEMYALMEKLLLAARLQEGLRQSVCENMDFGTREAFEYMFKVITDNDLLRFASIERAMDVFTGLLAADEKESGRITKKHAALISKYFENDSEIEKAFLGNDHMEIYLALWAIGTRSIEDAVNKAEELICKENRELSLTGAFFLKHNCKNSARLLRIIEKKTDSLDIIALLMGGFMTNPIPAMVDAVHKKDGKYREYVTHRVFINPTYYFADENESRDAYFILKKIKEKLPEKKVEFEGLVFPWGKDTLTKNDCISKMAFCASAAHDTVLTLEVARDITLVDKYERESALALLLNEPENREEYEILTRALSDAEEITRSRANTMLKHELSRDTSKLDSDIRATSGKLPAFCYEIMEEMLRLKKADLRQNVISFLMTMEDEEKVETIERLLSDKSEEKRTAGLDIILQLKKNDSPCYEKAAEKTKVISSPTTKEQVLLDEINASSGDASSVTGEIALFDPDADYKPVIDSVYVNECNEVWNRVFPNKKIGKKIFFAKNKVDDYKILHELDKLIEKNKNLEYEAWGDKVLLGNGIRTYFEDGKRVYPFTDLWDSFFDESIKSDEELVRLAFLSARSTKGYDVEVVKGFNGFCDKYIKEYFDADNIVINPKDYMHLPIVMSVIDYYCEKHDLSLIKSMVGAAVLNHVVLSDDSMIFSFTKDDIVNTQRDRITQTKFQRTPFMDHGFAFFINSINHNYKNFPIKYEFIQKYEGDYLKDSDLLKSAQNYYTYREKTSYPSIGEYVSACANGIISKDFLYKRIFDGNEKEAIELLSSVIIFIRESKDAKSTRVKRYFYRLNSLLAGLLGRRNIREKIDPESITKEESKILDMAEESYEKVISYIVGGELRRGDSPTKYSGYITSVGRLYGIDNFVGILKAFGKGTFNRSKYFYGSVTSKEDVLSHLLGVCVPDAREGDLKEQAAKLKEKIKGTDIKEKRLIEAALYSPEWVDIIGELLQIEGFRSGCYYFMAHMNEEFDDKRKAAIAKYSPISAEEFNAGAFDKTWFDEVYAILGEKKFDEIYDAAKYISDGSKHARARKYADAATGKLDAKKTREEIEKKRNKDLLMAYAIIDGSDKEIRDRYSYIRRFIKESRQFGAQRRASEKLAGETAIKNMATSQGYPDETRFVLKMENEIASELACYFDMQKVGDVEMCLAVEAGKVCIKVVKGGKELKSMPQALKKDEHAVDLQEAKQAFTEQYRRTKIMFEEAMESKTSFKKEEIDALRNNPVLTDMIDALVFECDNKFGFLKDLDVKKDADVYVAHSYTMFKAGVWKDMQSAVYENGIVQPFKQVFRELYVKTDEEINAYDSRRYAGNQIQTKKTVGALKSRRWVADVEEGLQKVYYKENIIATIYALADWFSPSDVEAPTLEWVAFIDRKKGTPLQIKEVPDIIFSEVMRDVDLAVSVAHAGEVDPEMSHSTVEMRRAIAEFACKSFKLKNVSFTDSHALVKGSRANYTIHLGSGIIHLEGGLMINVLPVHSQKRGRIFLPFVDDDPKTAEIISKILLFAEDEKIKDPFIINQIV